LYLVTGVQTCALPISGERYLDFFDNIRKIQRYVKSLALQRGVPIVPSYNLDSTLSQVIELVVTEAMGAVPSKNGSEGKDKR
jgi:2-phosphoglycerate kinase